MNPLVELLREGVEARLFPGGAFAVGTAEQVWTGAFGRLSYDPLAAEVDPTTMWDLASLTKVVGTTSAAMVLHDDGLLDLEAPVQATLLEFAGEGKATITPKQLLLHNSGLPPYMNVTFATSAAAARSLVLGCPLAATPGTTTAYSCLGFVTLQALIERLAGRTMDRLLTDRVFGPLGMTATLYAPSYEVRSRCAPTEAIAPWRRAVEDVRGWRRVNESYVQGGVHDPVAFMVGGVSGNAGLFSSAEDLGRFLQAMAARGRLGGAQVFCEATVEAWTRADGSSDTRALGWDTKSEIGSSAGAKFGPLSFGHTGYTGTSAWVDPEAGVFVALLTNRVHPDDSASLVEFRPRFADAAWDWLVAL